jgi:ATP-dependent DNA helicase RecG
MRPSLLNPLFAAVTTLPGIGPRLEKLYRRLLGREDAARVVDLLLHLPTGTIDRRARPKLRDVTPDTVVTVAVTVDRHRPSPPHRPRAPYQIYTSDETGDLILTYFNARKDYLQTLLPVGERRYVSGTITLYDHMLQMVHPDRVVAEADLAKLPLVEPVYPLTEGLSLNQVHRAVQAALARVPKLPEWQDPSWVARERFPPFAEALRVLHRHGRGSPTTSSWPASLRSRWCAPICGARPAARRPAPATSGRG